MSDTPETTDLEVQNATTEAGLAEIEIGPVTRLGDIRDALAVELNIIQGNLDGDEANEGAADELTANQELKAKVIDIQNHLRSAHSAVEQALSLAEEL